MNSQPNVADAIRDHITRHVRTPTAHEVTATTLWTLHTHLIDVATTTPYLLVTSPVHGCGKSTLMNILTNLTANPWATSHTSVAALYRSVAGRTVLLDEVDTMLAHPGISRDLGAVLNAGYARGPASVINRCVGDAHKPTAFDVFGAKLIAGIDLPAKLKASTLSRTIEIRLERAHGSEGLVPYGDEASTKTSVELRASIAEWADEHRDVLASATVTSVTHSDMRYLQVWQPLLTIARMLGPEWATAARQAFEALAPEAEDTSDETIRLTLLRDLRRVFLEPGGRNLTTDQILTALKDLDDSPWRVWGHRRTTPGLTARDLAGLLRPFRVRPVTIRVGRHNEQTKKGYRYADLVPVWERYSDKLDLEDEEPVYGEFGDEPLDPDVLGAASDPGAEDSRPEGSRWL
ncbi:DUF3631 domain-containing protein [Patulibacter defluvii]|uniref:DUF3631 domain-containing protein n=1 Tax=Patulibacter defluvii TaxID=3095358 RepID=UPI002A760D46|nr:DUF3631 domain-containing protein [Patulibacter sp. DM4]